MFVLFFEQYIYFEWIPVSYFSIQNKLTLILEAAWENLHTWDVEEDYPVHVGAENSHLSYVDHQWLVLYW